MKQNRSLLLAALTLLPAAGSAAVVTQLPDTLKQRTYNVGDAVVTGTRTATDVRHLSQTVTVVGRDQIEQSGEASLLPVLSQHVPGLFTTARGVMGYGVSDGAAGGISLRGLSGGSARMMVLIDGHPQYAGIFGHPVADAYQSLLAERVEVLRGPASVLYGSNAMGGVVNIVTRRMAADGVRTQLHAGYGSFNTVETEFTNLVRHGRFTSVVSGSYNRTDGHRDNMPFEQTTGYAKLGYELSNHWTARADADVTHFNASYPGPVTAPLLEGDQRITRGMASVAIDNDYDRTSGGLSFFYNWGNHWINDGYTPSEGETPQDGRFRSRDNMMGISAYQSVRLFGGSRVTAGVDWFRYGGEAWTQYVKGDRAGTRTDLVDKHEDEVAGYVDWRQDLGRRLTLNAGLRVDHHSRVGTEWVPQAGLAWRLPKNAELKASVAKGFRYPILREMYMFPPQNPDLKPERAWNYELGFAQRVAGGRLRYGVNLFFIDGDNLIQTLPNPNGSGRLNQNTGSFLHTGVELQAAWQASKAWTVEGNYSYLHMDSPLVAAPEHKLYVGASFAAGRWRAASGVQYIAGLYTSTAPVVKENYVLWNARAAFRVTKWLDVWAKGENLLASRYEINRGYPMPKATALVGFDVKF